MGQEQSVTTQIVRKKIVIVGASFGGRLLTQKLQELDPMEEYLDILLVDKSPHFEYICSNYKALTDEGVFEHNSIDFSEAIKSFKSERVKY